VIIVMADGLWTMVDQAISYHHQPLTMDHDAIRAAIAH
jgi:hypothetical protein